MNDIDPTGGIVDKRLTLGGSIDTSHKTVDQVKIQNGIVLAKRQRGVGCERRRYVTVAGRLGNGHRGKQRGQDDQRNFSERGHSVDVEAPAQNLGLIQKISMFAMVQTRREYV